MIFLFLILIRYSRVYGYTHIPGPYLNQKYIIACVDNLRKAIVFISHGLGEHILRYEHLARFLNANGYSVFGMDHQGHGQSEGDRTHVVKFQDYVDDYLFFVEKIVHEQPKLPKFMIAHSMGGLIGAQVARFSPTLWNGVILSGPLLKPDPKLASPFMIFITRFLANFLPKLGVETIPASNLSHDKQVIEKYQTDPLIFHGAYSTLLFLLIMQHSCKLGTSSTCCNGRFAC